METSKSFERTISPSFQCQQRRKTIRRERRLDRRCWLHVTVAGTTCRPRCGGRHILHSSRPALSALGGLGQSFTSPRPSLLSPLSKLRE